MSGNNNPDLGFEKGNAMNDIEQQIRDCATARDKVKLLDWIGKASSHPESPISQLLVVEGLRVDALQFFGDSKSTISSLHAKKPSIVGETSVPDLQDFEGIIADYLKSHNTEIDQIIDRKTEDPNVATYNVLSRLAERIYSWDDEENGMKEYTAASLEHLGEHDITPDNLRTAISTTAQGVAEALWDSSTASREARIDILGHETPYEQIDLRFSRSVDDDFIAATTSLTGAIMKLQII